MKIFISLLVLTFCLFSLSCSESEIITKSNKLLVLEVSKDAQGMWNVRGKTLFFRLYDNGFVEFEYPDDKKIDTGKSISNAEEVNTLIQTKISEKEFRKFIDLLNSDDFQKINDIYTRRCCCTDAILDFKIKFQNNNKQTTVNLNDYCGLYELENLQFHYLPDFPKVLSELMILIENTRAKYILRQKSSNLIQQKLK